MLLERSDLNPNIPDILDGLTPLLLAVKDEDEYVVRMLLRRNDINPNTPDTLYGQTGYRGLPRMGVRV